MATPVLSKVHTFASDLNQARLNRGAQTVTPTITKTPTPPTSTPQNQSSATTPISQSNPTKPTHTPIKLKASAARDASYPATIITDKKRQRFNLTTEMSNVISDWWKETIGGVKRAKTPTYSVPAVERRKGVVATATTITGRVAATDHKEIVARIKNDPQPQAQAVATTATNLTPIPDTQTPTVAAAEQTPVWETAVQTINLETIHDSAPEVALASNAQQPVVSEPTIVEDRTKPVNQNSLITVTSIEPRRSRIEPTIPTPFEVMDTSDIDAPEEQAVESDTIEEQSVTQPTPIIPEPVKVFDKIKPVLPNIPPLVTKSPSENIPPRRENAFTLLSEVPAPVLPTVAPHVKATLAERAEVARLTAPETPQRFASLLRLLPYFAGITFVLITAGSIGYFFMSGTSEPVITTTSTELPAIPTTDFSDNNWSMTNTPVSAQLDAPNKASLYTAIKDTAGLGEGLHLVTPLAHDSALPLATRDILSLINRQFTPAFLGTITQVRVGMYREEPVILLTISDEATARGGMFGWERTMSQDLSPWFGVALRHMSTSTLTGFVDGRSTERDVRILKDDIGTERITYGFLNTTTILITSNTTAFLNIADQDWY